jgi:MFS family permease
MYEQLLGSYFLAAQVFSISWIIQTLVEFPTGLLSDRFGRRNILLIGAALNVLGLSALWVAMTSGTHPLLFLPIFVVANGLVAALFSGNNIALIYDILPTKHLRSIAVRVIAKLNYMRQVSLLFVGVLAAILLFFETPMHFLVAGSIIASVIALVLAVMIPQFQQTGSRDNINFHEYLSQLYVTFRSQKPLRMFLLASAINNGIGQSAHSFLPGYIGMLWPYWMTSLYKLSQNFLGIFAFKIAANIVRRVGLLKSVLHFNALSTGVTLIAYWLSSIASPVLLMLTQYPWAISHTAEQGIQQSLFDERFRSAQGSLTALGGALVSAIGISTAGLIADIYSPVVALSILQLLTIPSLLIYWKLLHGL